MSIDGIRKSSPPAGSPTASGEVPRSAEVGRPFEAQRTTPAAEVAPLAQSGPLGSLQSGAVNVEGYLDLKVNEATAHLAGLPASDLLRVRAALRERLATDPTLVDLVRNATGSVPPAPDDD
jgi:hypothetical protein